MEIIYVSIAIVIIAVIKIIYDNREYERSLERQMKENWGKIPEQTYTEEKFKSLEMYFREHYVPNLDVDDITWNDLDMDNIFMLMNQTQTAMGEEYLYSLLRKPLYDEAKLKERDDLIEFFQREQKTRFEVQKSIGKLGKLSSISIYEYINRVKELEERDSKKHIAYAIGFVLSFLSIFFLFPFGVFLFLFMLANNVTKYYKAKAEIENYFSVFSYVLRMMDSVKSLNKVESEKLKPYLDPLKDSYHALRKFQAGAGVVVSRKAVGGLADMILDYVRMFMHFDIIKFNSMLRELRVHNDELMLLFETIGFLDSMIAIGSFREWLQHDYTKPELVHSEKPFLNVNDVYHPMISNPVRNSIREKQCVLITGSNASGKSTFIKTIAMNQILCQTVYMSLSKHHCSSYFRIFSSMALRDDLSNNESYYIVEIKSLKRMLDQANQKIPMLCFVDEVLRGTNTLERIAASSQILVNFAKTNSICFAATHDIELTYILENYYSNYHFQEEFHDDTISFNYLLREGRSTTKNAINLLKVMGYEDDIIKEAKHNSEEFLRTGSWNIIS